MVVEVEEFLKGEVGAEEVGSLPCCVNFEVFRLELAKFPRGKEGFEEEAEVGDPRVFLVVRDLVAKEEDGVGEVGGGFVFPVAFIEGGDDFNASPL